MLTFATPTILAGDRSLTSLVAHELAHSWSGNLVTNATWSDFWLNEGFTVYFELRIMEALYGPERMAMLEVLGRRELVDEIARPRRRPRRTRTCACRLAGRNPDDGMTTDRLRQGRGAAAAGRAGGRAAASSTPGCGRWFDRHAFTSSTTASSSRTFARTCSRDDAALEQHQPAGVDRRAGHPAQRDAAARPPLRAGGCGSRAVQRRHAGVGSCRQQGWVTQQWQHFLSQLPSETARDATRRPGRGVRLQQDRKQRGPVRVAADRDTPPLPPAMPALEHFLTSQGRRKFLQPLYRT